jgi:hypothetical protein
MLGTILVGAWLAACSQPAPLGAQGTVCEVATDCQAGLACVPQADGTRQCSNDFTPIQSTEEAGGGMDAAAAQEAAPQADGPAPQGDTGGPPPQDTGSPPQDTGSPPQDTGSPPQDTGSPPQDTGSPPQDTGTGETGGG